MNDNILKLVLLLFDYLCYCEYYY